ncbi:dATP/dGTP diphosphohydrolase domain-containing protein [Vreelandella maris]|uniref:dATP/dGTP diphosphohydrolase domain-containing protein n=1 Tax=Vreelandella maris TaxID=2729617 RepID=UPI0030ECFE72
MSSTACDDQWNEDRADVIGQNGNDGQHYGQLVRCGCGKRVKAGSYEGGFIAERGMCCNCYGGEADGPGMKFDNEKPRFDLLLADMPLALEAVANVLTYGAAKYADGNWAQVENAQRRYLAAGIRHELALAKGERCDPETGEHHLAHKLCSDLFRLELALREKAQ